MNTLKSRSWAQISPSSMSRSFRRHVDTRLPSGVAKIEAKSSVRIRGQAGETILLTSEEFSDNGSAHIIKRNRRGQFNYRRWSVGPSAKRSGEIRGVISIEAL